MIFAFAVTHFSMLASSYVKTTACARSLACRFTLISVILMEMGAIATAIFLNITANEDFPAWYLVVSSILSIFFIIFEIKRTCGFSKEQKKVNMLARASSFSESVVIEESNKDSNALSGKID